MIRYSTWR